MDIDNKGHLYDVLLLRGLSNYCTAALYFKARNGTYKSVLIYDNADLDGKFQVEMAVYYTQQDFCSNRNQKITAFKAVSQPTLALACGELTHLRVSRWLLGSTLISSKDKMVVDLRYTCFHQK